MSLILFIVCFVILIVRIRRGTTLVVPAIGTALALLSLLHSVVVWSRIFGAVGAVDPSDKATILSAGISEMMASTMVMLIAMIPLTVVGYVVDRWLRKRALTRLPDEPEAAPRGSVCSSHLDRPAVLTCVRCGGFACRSCAADNRVQCSGCAERAQTSASA